MGEYALFGGERVKIGTCEDMYYLRFNQRGRIDPLSGNVDPRQNLIAQRLRFRFPWPDEDNIQPGGFDDFHRSLWIPGLVVPNDVDHNSVQFVAHRGYLCSLPCPESGNFSHGVTIHRNGFRGAVHLVQQKLLADGRVVPVMMCGGCETKWRVEDEIDILATVEALKAEGEKRKKDSRTNDGEPVGDRFWNTIANRILASAGISAVCV